VNVRPGNDRTVVRTLAVVQQTSRQQAGTTYSDEILRNSSLARARLPVIFNNSRASRCSSSLHSGCVGAGFISLP